MSTILLAAVEQVAANPDEADAFTRGLQVSGVALLGIFAVMGLFALMIVILTNLFPDGNDKT